MVLLFIPENAGTFEKKVQQLNQIRLARSCVEGIVGDGEVEGHPLLDSYLPFTFLVQIGIIAAGILVIILIIGVIKGLIGLFLYPPIGMLGLGYLVDLPRMMNKYQERELAQMKVVYDSVGWPIHPQTGKRTVRAVTKRMEFCVNVIFFISLPLVIIISILSACFAHKTYDEDDGGECYQKVNTIMLSDTPSLKVLAKGCTTKGSASNYNAGGKGPCPTKGKGPNAVDSNITCKNEACKSLLKSSLTPSNSKSKSSSSGSGAKSAIKSSKSSKASGKSGTSDKSKKSKSKSKSKPSKGSPSKTKSNKSKKSKSKVSGKGSGQKKPKKSKSQSTNSAYKDDDSVEAEDTQYVLDQLQESEMSLKK